MGLGQTPEQTDGGVLHEQQKRKLQPPTVPNLARVQLSPPPTERNSIPSGTRDLRSPTTTSTRRRAGIPRAGQRRTDQRRTGAGQTEGPGRYLVCSRPATATHPGQTRDSAPATEIDRVAAASIHDEPLLAIVPVEKSVT